MSDHRQAAATPRGALGRAGSEAAYEGDVLLIADEPRLKARGRNGRQHPEGAPSQASPEPFDMESVVRKLIALLREEAGP